MILKIQRILESCQPCPEGQVRDLLSVARGPDGRNIGAISPCVGPGDLMDSNFRGTSSLDVICGFISNVYFDIFISFISFISFITFIMF